jgi:hypothetical protein
MANEVMSGDAMPAVAGVPMRLLRLEGAALLAAAVVTYWHIDAPRWIFILLILAPDLSFLGYLAGPRVGAAVYNAAHTTLGPLALALFGVLAPSSVAIAVALIWAAHIGADRMLGYGLKYGAGFAFTHLGRIGRGAL